MVSEMAKLVRQIGEFFSNPFLPQPLECDMSFGHFFVQRMSSNNLSCQRGHWEIIFMQPCFEERVFSSFNGMIAINKVVSDNMFINVAAQKVSSDL